jgi:hypothetical protein
MASPSVFFHYNPKKYVDYKSGLAYDSHIPLVRGVSGDDP